ncbi:presequence translocase associated motor 16 [Homo sapiens]|uniref:HCG15164, isoform CRA_a n=1 Tax=Homo sapiens TaxID=9606 RepID=A0A0B4J298_HUMAN|nr:hCG15164, isoform CRA_a [Homo sapiens]KAI2576863.1 presequence translocase associated motor 16 [Homo sapiens]KAI4053267.1 presequence translocase associated motor 16 [Homo sapiens]
MAKYLAQIIVMGVQVVGRAFARALRQEFAGVSHQLGRPRVKCGLLRTERSPTCPHSQPGRS